MFQWPVSDVNMGGVWSFLRFYLMGSPDGEKLRLPKFSPGHADPKNNYLFLVFKVLGHSAHSTMCVSVRFWPLPLIEVSNCWYRWTKNCSALKLHSIETKLFTIFCSPRMSVIIVTCWNVLSIRSTIFQLFLHMLEEPRLMPFPNFI